MIVKENGRMLMLGGPIKHAISEGKFLPDIEEAIIKIICELKKYGFTILSAHEVESFGKDKNWTPQEVTIRDINWMKECDAFIAFFPLDSEGFPVRSDGTHIELGWASALGKPMLLVTQTPLSDGFSHLVKGLDKIASLTIINYETLNAEPSIIVHALDNLFSTN